MKTLVITGASKGIGFETALKFLDLGYAVINISRTAAPRDEIVNLSIDLGSPDAGAQLQTQLLSRLQASEIVLVHNAAMLVSGKLQETSTADLQAAISLNVVAPHVLTRTLLNHMQPGSSIIYIGSTLSEKAVPNSYTYVTTKHAVIGMMRAACQDLVNTGIHTACICPGFTDTEMLRAHVGQDDQILASIAATTAFSRLITPQEIADTIVFAAQNPVINGAVLHANLGQIET